MVGFYCRYLRLNLKTLGFQMSVSESSRISDLNIFRVEDMKLFDVESRVADGVG